MNNELYMAILAMDSYNRGYGEGINGLGGAGSRIGNAIYRDDALPNGAQSAGFYAASYTLNGQTVISYRGTDNPSLLANATGASDILSGWAACVGVPVNDNAAFDERRAA